MRYTISLIVCTLLFAQCKNKIEVYPTGTYDTLGVQWMTMERNNITYYFQGSGERGASLFTDLHEEAYEELVPVFHPQLPQKLRLFVWTDWQAAEQKLGHPLGFAVPANCVCHIRFNQSLGHEITHIFSYWANGIKPSTYSKFISEGIAVAFDLREDNKILTAKNALKGYTISSIKEIWTANNQAVPDDLLYPVGGTFVQYLYNRSQPDEFFTLIKKQTLQDAEHIYGKEKLNSLITHFDAKLGL